MEISRRQVYSIIAACAAALTVIILLLVLPIIPRTKNPPIKIGALISLTGIGADMTDVRDGMAVAVDEINAHGGINGSRIDLIVEDSKSEPDEAVKKFRMIETSEKPLLFTGTLSSVSLKLAPVAEKAKVPLICLVATNPTITENREWVYSFFPTAELEVPPIISIIKQFGVTDFGMLYLDDAYGRSVYQEMSKQFADADDSFHGIEYTITTTDFREQIELLKNSEAVYAVGYASHLHNIFTQLKEADYRGIILAPSTATTPDFRDNGRSDNIYVAAPIIYKENYRFSKQIKEAYEKRYKKKFNHYAATGYEFLKLIASVLEDIPVTREALQKELEKGFVYPGILGDIIIESGESVLAFPLYPAKVMDGKLEYSF